MVVDAGSYSMAAEGGECKPGGKDMAGGGGWQKQRKHARNRKNGTEKRQHDWKTGMGRPGAEVGMCVGGAGGGKRECKYREGLDMI